MTSSRVKEPVPAARALELLAEQKGQSLDRDCVEALMDKLRPRPNTIPLAPRPRYPV